MTTPKLHHGNVLNGPAIAALEFGWLEQWRTAGFGVIGWGYLDASSPPADIARLAVDLCRRFDLDGYIADAEAECEGTAGRWRLRPFLDEFRAHAPRAPLAVSGMGAAYDPWVRELDYPAVAELADIFMPQAYPNEYGDVYSVPNCIAHADRAGLARELVVPTLGTYPGRYGYDVGLYAGDLRDAGTHGFNIFLGETAKPEDYEDFAHAVEDHGIARW